MSLSMTIAGTGAAATGNGAAGAAIGGAATGAGGGASTLAGGGGAAVSPFWACMKHPHPPKSNPHTATTSTIPVTFVFTILPSFLFECDTSESSYTGFLSPHSIPASHHLSLRVDKPGLLLFLERLLDYDLDTGYCPGNCLANRRARLAPDCFGCFKGPHCGRRSCFFRGNADLLRRFNRPHDGILGYGGHISPELGSPKYHAFRSVFYDRGKMTTRVGHSTYGALDHVLGRKPRIRPRFRNRADGTPRRLGLLCYSNKPTRCRGACDALREALGI